MNITIKANSKETTKLNHAYVTNPIFIVDNKEVKAEEPFWVDNRELVNFNVSDIVKEVEIDLDTDVDLEDALMCLSEADFAKFNLLLKSACY